MRIGVNLGPLVAKMSKKSRILIKVFKLGGVSLKSLSF